MKKFIYKIMMMSFGIFSLASCITDNSTLGSDNISSIEFGTKSQKEDGSMPEYNFNLGETCVIDPQISTAGVNEEDLKYTWYVGTFTNKVKGDLEKVSNEKVLNYKFPKGGTYYVHLVVTDGKIGKVIDYSVNINRTFEEGYILVSKNTSGVGNLSFIKIRTPEEITAGKNTIIFEKFLEKMNEGIASEDNLVDCAIGTITWPKAITRLLVSTTDRCYFLDPNTMSIISELKYTDIYPDFKADIFMSDDYSPYAYDSTLKKYVNLDLNYMFPYEYKYYKGQSFDNYYRCQYKSWDRVSNKTIFVDSSKPVVADFNPYVTGYFLDTEDLLVGKTILTTFMETAMNQRTYVTPLYILAEDSENVILYKNETRKITDSSSFTTQQLAKSNELAIPTKGTRMQPSEKFQRYYYYIDSKIYVFAPGFNFALPTKSQFAYDFGSNEEVTAMTTDLKTERLFVATFDKTKGRGNFYIFNTSDVATDKQGSINPVESYKGCADRIFNIIYKPRV